MARTGTDTTDEEEERTLHIRFEERDEQRVEEALAALDRGESPEPYYEVSFDDPEDVHRVTRPQNLALLRAIVQHEPESIRETARLVDRDVRSVHRNLSELEDLHLLELVDEGQSKRPRVWYDGIELDLPLDEDDRPADEAAA
jgi:predicted transcriptional regulator